MESYHDTKMRNVTIHAVVKPLLAYLQVCVDDAPNALPPLRNIQHQIDLSRKTTLLVSISNEVLGFNSIKELYASDEDLSNTWMELETNQHRDRRTNTCGGACFDEEIVKFPTQPATTEISGDNGSNLEDFLIVLTREEADIIRPIMTVKEEPPSHDAWTRTWDPGITWLKILKEHLEDKVFLRGEWTWPNTMEYFEAFNVLEYLWGFTPRT
ncbi:hypothetical protein Tco_0145537 [Tanacetum coccineum]